MKVSHISPIYAQVPPLGYGGIERVIYELIECQKRLGQYSLSLYGPSDSNVNVELRSTISSFRSIKRSTGLNVLKDLEQRHYKFACTDSTDINILHAHGTWILPYVHLTNKPVVVSIYTDTSNPIVQQSLKDVPNNVYLIANSQRTHDKFKEARWHGVVLEGVMLERYPFSKEKNNELLFVGELTQNKGCHIAIQVALHLGMKLKIIGRKKILDVPEEEVRSQQNYVANEIDPYINDKQIQYLGEMGEERLEYIKNSKIVLCPILWEEPFGRIMTESMACGTPVVAMRRGAAPEVISDGVSGFIVDDFNGMVDAVRQARWLNPINCRKHVYENLNMRRVAEQYSSIYNLLSK